VKTNELAFIFETKGLKKTAIRLKVLEYLVKKQSAISQPELEKKFKNEADRVTLYRVLNVLQKKGIVHKIIDLEGTSRYALCFSKDCTDDHHHDEHIHFNCNKCDRVVCITDSITPKIKLPRNFRLSHITLNAVGICDKCMLLNKKTA